MKLYTTSRHRANAIDLLAALETDKVFRIPAVRLADAHSQHANTYFYRFSWRSPAFEGRIGAAHGLDLPFVWDKLDGRLSRWLAGPNPT